MTDKQAVREDVLFYKLKDLITEQSEGEWDDVTIIRDARHFANHLRPLMAAAPSVQPGADREEMGYCKTCNGPRAVSPCHKCGGALQPAADGWEWPELPSIDRIRELAREVGYSVGIHGSLERDLDLIAIPWTADAVSPPELAAHIAAGLPGQVLADVVQDKPSGRWSCNINPEGWFKMIDLSVMPPQSSAANKALGNLLAVIHRDGGHRQEAVGVEKAAIEAEGIIAHLLSTLQPVAQKEEG